MTTIKAENWQTLANTVAYMCESARWGADFKFRVYTAFKLGKPGDYLKAVVAHVRHIERTTYNGVQRRMAQSLIETFKNYGLKVD